MAKRGRPYNLPEIRKRVEFIIDRIGIQNLLDHLISPTTGRPISRSTLYDYLSGRIRMKPWFSSRVSSLYLQLWEQEYFQVYDIDSWWMLVEEEVIRTCEKFEPVEYERGLEYMRDLLAEAEAEDILLIKNYKEPLFGWINYTGKITDIQKDLEVFFFLLFLRSPYNTLIGRSFRMSEFIWNYPRKRITKENLAEAFDKIFDAAAAAVSIESEQVGLAATFILAFKVIEEE